MAKRKTLFISDLHLDESNPQITNQFLQLLQRCDSSIDALYILGDLFEVWIGYDNAAPLHHKIIQALNSAIQKGLTIYFMRGNRDFLIGKKFLRATGCKLLADETIINLYGQSVLLMHGDTLCTRDIEYIKARKLMRNPTLQILFLLLPLKTRRKLADKMRAKSMAHTQSTALDIMDVTQEEVIRVMKQHGVQILIHGHTHRPDMHPLSVNNFAAERIVLGAWHDGMHVLEWDENGNKKIINI